MISRVVVGRAHLAAAVIAFAAILLFWISTAVSELSGDTAAIAAVKRSIPWGMLVLVPALAIAGGTGFRLGGRSRAPVIAAKRRRMPIIALNGLLVLLPSAFFLAGRAAEGRFDEAFYAVQAIELAAGAVNIALMGLSMRDGLAMTRGRRRAARLRAQHTAI